MSDAGGVWLVVMVMTLERRIAFAVFAIGVAVVVLALVSCDSPSEAACDDGDFALPVLGARLIDEDSIRFAYAGGEPCSFAVDRYKVARTWSSKRGRSRPSAAVSIWLCRG